MHRPDGSELKIAEHHFAEIEIHKEKRQKGDFLSSQNGWMLPHYVFGGKSRKKSNGIRGNEHAPIFIGQKLIKSPGPFTFEFRIEMIEKAPEETTMNP